MMIIIIIITVNNNNTVKNRLSRSLQVPYICVVVLADVRIIKEWTI